jgi:hypothetical protein
MVLVMQGKLDEAKVLFEQAWRLKSGQHDITSARLLFVRLTVALLESHNVEEFVGHLKTVAALIPLPDHADVTRIWDIGYFLDHLRPKLPTDSM